MKSSLKCGKSLTKFEILQERQPLKEKLKTKTELHPRNRHRDPYDFHKLIKTCPDLAKFVAINNYGKESIDFTHPKAVKTLNKALLKFFYNITWDIPEPFLCPPIPSRADYIHHIADLIGPQSKKVSILDIGVGANCVYPLVGHREYGWSFVGTDIDPLAVSIANRIIQQNGLSEVIEVRLQKSPANIFKGILKDDSFDISMCNPPFHASLSDAKEGTQRKWKNLKVKTNVLNFGGQSNELCYPGGEIVFIKRMIEESIDIQCKWFTTLVSKASSLPSIYKALDHLKALDVREIPMSQGQKKSRIIAWKFQ